MTPPLRYGLLGTGSIAEEFAHSLHLTAGCTAEAVASRSADRAAAFAAQHGVRRAIGDYPSLLADPDVDVVYVATPHHEHAWWSTLAIRAGKAVLCEKPLAVDEAQALGVVREAQRHGSALLEAFAYRFHPQTAAVLGLVRDGAIGTVRAIDITFSFHAPVAEPDAHRLTANALAGGGILDVGCYCTSMSSLIVATATGAAAPEPEEIVGLAVLEPTERTDLFAAGVLRYSGGILAQLACGVGLEQDDHIRIYGSAGSIYVPQPCWLAGQRAAASFIGVADHRGVIRAIDVPGGTDIMALEADGFATMLHSDKAAFRRSWAESLANMRTLDRWRRAVGVHYDIE